VDGRIIAGKGGLLEPHRAGLDRQTLLNLSAKKTCLNWKEEMLESRRDKNRTSSGLASAFGSVYGGEGISRPQAWRAGGRVRPGEAGERVVDGGSGV